MMIYMYFSNRTHLKSGAMLMRNARSPCPALLLYIHNVPMGHISMFNVKGINTNFLLQSHVQCHKLATERNDCL